jgi:hypothetical protein
MLKRKIRNLVVIAVAIASVTGLAALSATSASAETRGTYLFIVNSGYTPLHLTANGIGNAITISNGTTNDHWNLVGPEYWTNLNGQYVAVWEVQHAGTNNCINQTDPEAIMSPCNAGNTDEQFWLDSTGSVNVGINVWLINRGWSQGTRHYIFLTASGLSNGEIVEGASAGSGGLAAWDQYPG